MSASSILRATALALLATGLAGAAQAQAPFPSKPIQMIVPFTPGGASDLTIRALSKAAEPALGQPVVVVNKPAGGGAVAMQEVAKAEPDGYTLVNSTAILAAIAPHMRQLPFDPLKDFAPVMLYGAFNTFVAVRSDSPYKKLDDLLDYARKNPRVVTVGISVIGASSHLGMARLANDAKAQVTFVPFGGGAPAITALVGRHITSAVTSGEVLPQVQAGEVRLLATLMAERIKELPDVPTVRELGFPWAMNSWLGVAGPPGLPEPVVKKLEAAFLGAMNDDTFKKVMLDLAMGTLRGDAAAARKALDDDFASFGGLIKELKLGRYAN
jgi:tripartite-type tricarboxylate transporter receptor subunit TctC